MRAFFVVLLSVLLLPSAHAQIIQVKTIPVVEGHSFDLFPGNISASGGASIAISDDVGDVYVNPALGARSTPSLTVSPRVFAIADDPSMITRHGTAWSLPLHTMHRQGRVFGGMSVVLQRFVDDAEPFSVGIRPANVEWPDPDNSATNGYVGGNVGYVFPESNWSAGLSAVHGILNRQDGVDLLYGRALSMDQDGRTTVVRAGVAHEDDLGRATDVVVAFHDFRMTHTLYEGLCWFMPCQMQGDPAPAFEMVPRIEEDVTRGVGVQTTHRRAISDRWNLGGMVAGNWKHHAKIPDYDLMRVPRDPGNTQAYQLGVGVARQTGDVRMATDLIFEPIWSHTWAEADRPTTTSTGSTLRPGDKTVDNRFRLRNWRFRTGMTRTGDGAGFSLGLDVRRIAYRLEQDNRILVQQRTQRESWLEWTFSAGTSFRVGGVELGYTGKATLGTGIPSVGGFMLLAPDTGFRSDFAVAPAGDLVLDDLIVVSGQVHIRVPF